MRGFWRSGYFLAPLVGAVFCGLVAPAGAEPEQKSSALSIFDAALAKFEADRVALHKWQYHQTLITHQLDSSAKVVASGTWQSIVRPGDPGPLEYTGKHVEGKISFFESGSEAPQAAVEKSPSPEAKSASSASAKTNQVESAVAVVRKYNLRNRYDWKRLPDATAAGEDAYVLAFSPKPNQNTKTREERFFGLLTGQMWISKRDFTVLKAEGALRSPCHLFWVIARVTVFHFSYELEPAVGDNRLLRTSKASAQTEVSFPFYKVRQKHWQTVDKYEPRTPRGSGGKKTEG